MSPRAYSSPLRQAEAERTRAAILDASAVLFSREGYVATTMKSIAEQAGVSVQSVHLAGPKSALLIAAFERAFAGDEGRHSLSERPALVEIMARPDVNHALTGWLDYVAQANARTAGLSRAMTVAAETDPVAQAAVADLDARRRSDIGIAAGWLISRGLLAADAKEEATDELNYVVGPETYAFFVERSGWRDTRYREWLQTTVLGLLGRWKPEGD
ncbi:AcrR family transcriptional regulator [Microbacteriaceae bacterium SG_E_30_P1]|uniref:AcrR family transcriptional regulator n=1 Tax=Antiquaquibacter oligotrophicus TaxID=2880260 RepID=A0ABT6KRY7_9MICO|nr:TetR/AcrR family transcriptional regulator [Antiquaquibacter oligotrophicus]MDH6181959.1 AcrR family transcriptional regulator [Antiquaquibacter oligotrophicus]UDF12372.1 TetR/AcrR family transcriptional regulator [Antiquaquibacter oligotrophicus]